MLTKEQRDEILRLAAELIKAPSDTWGSFGRLVKFTKYIDSITAPEGWQTVPVEPTREMIEAGAQRLVSWEDGCVWPDSWSPLQVSAARNEADRVWRSMWLAAAPKPGDSNE